MARTKTIFGNWKMNMTLTEAKKFVKAAELKLKGKTLKCNLGLAVPATHLATLKPLCKKIKLAAQTVNENESGAYTGEVSATMLKDLKVKYSIIGHSERRSIYGETDAAVNLKAKVLIKNGITPILCFGETEAEYVAKKTKSVVKRQLTKALKGIAKKDIETIIFAYEPVWAIGTGKTATAKQAQEIIKYAREILAKLVSKAGAGRIIIQYGGSVKPTNINSILMEKDIDGALVGGASLKVKSFLDLAANC